MNAPPDAMTDLVDLIIEDRRWRGLAELAGVAANAALAIAGVSPKGFEISVLGCDDTRITVLNSDFRDKPRATNVLSWPAFELANPGGMPDLPRARFVPESLGDIAISYDTCLREAADSGTEFNHHVTHLVLHGCLHLLGYDHETDADARIMERLEVKALAKLGIPDPY